VPDTGHDLGAILLDRLARAAPRSPLPPTQVHRQIVGGQGEPRRDALDDRPSVWRAIHPRQEAERSHRRLVPLARSS